MKKDDILHGFIVRETRRLNEHNATLIRMEYVKNGAQLVWLDRKDDNKTFAVTFKTIPSDDTGVFHILEHSVFCGSEKFPLKDPFVELRKSSLQTFMNAFTFSDKTMYPVCSRNDRDFLTLIDVYMDAVLHPLCVKNPYAFLQEGWHYEFDESGDICWNGVVYNEMKGAFASDETVVMSELERLLFPDNCYRFDAGGRPEHITELTYDFFKECHSRYYHPSNARFILDGGVDIDAVLSLLDSFLRDYERRDVCADIPMQKPVHPQERTIAYAVDAQEDDENKVILAEGWVMGCYDELEKSIACSVLADALCGSNEAPLCRAIVLSGLAEDVQLQLIDGILQPYMMLMVRGTSADNREQVRTAFYNTLEEAANVGLDRARLHALLNRYEFVYREKDTGTMPRGIVYATDMLETWLYGGDPAQNLCCGEVFASLHAKAETGYFEELIREVFLKNPHQAHLCALPSKTIDGERAKSEAQKLTAVRNSWDDAEKARLRAQSDELHRYQSALSKGALPTLTLCDIPESMPITPQSVSEVCGVTLLHQPIETSGITYAEMYFSLADIAAEELSAISFFASLLGQCATQSFDTLALMSELEGCLGGFDAGTTVTAKVDETESCTPYLVVRFSVLDSRRDEAIRLAGEILRTTRFDDAGFIGSVLRQERSETERELILSGNAFALKHIGAALSAKGAAEDALHGMGMLEWLRAADDAFEEKGGELLAVLTELRDRLFTRERLTLAVTGEADEKWTERLISSLRSSPMGKKASIYKRRVGKDGFTIPADIAFAAMSSNLSAADAKFSGPALVAAQILNYNYLWNEIRVKGGAYGAWMSVYTDGDVCFATYRDPDPARSLNCFKGAGVALREFCAGDEELDKYIISTVAACSPLLTPKTEGSRASRMYLCGRTEDDERELRRQILHTTKAELIDLSYALDKLFESTGVCVIGSQNAIAACADKLSD